MAKFCSSGWAGVFLPPSVDTSREASVGSYSELDISSTALAFRRDLGGSGTSAAEDLSTLARFVRFRGTDSAAVVGCSGLGSCTVALRFRAEGAGVNSGAELMGSEVVEEAKLSLAEERVTLGDIRN